MPARRNIMSKDDFIRSPQKFKEEKAAVDEMMLAEFKVSRSGAPPLDAAPPPPPPTTTTIAPCPACNPVVDIHAAVGWQDGDT